MHHGGPLLSRMAIPLGVRASVNPRAYEPSSRSRRKPLGLARRHGCLPPGCSASRWSKALTRGRAPAKRAAAWWEPRRRSRLPASSRSGGRSRALVPPAGRREGTLRRRGDDQPCWPGRAGEGRDRRRANARRSAWASSVRPPIAHCDRRLDRRGRAQTEAVAAPSSSSTASASTGPSVGMARLGVGESPSPRPRPVSHPLSCWARDIRFPWHQAVPLVLSDHGEWSVRVIVVVGPVRDHGRTATEGL